MKRWLLSLLVVLLGRALLLPAGPAAAQDSDQERARALMGSMSPEERIGQLFLVSFTGTDISSKSQIYDLIATRHIGGVMLLASNDNFTGGTQTVTDARDLVTGLQQIEWDTYLSPVVIDPLSGTRATHSYIPLFVGTLQEGDGGPFDQIFEGLTPIAPEMALGATWETSQTETSANVLGSELAAIGLNLYIGPSLDVLTNPRPDSAGDPGVNVFGGSPFWVGEMGQAYISGLHAGSKGKLAVFASNFPGRGDADRAPQDEFSTVSKSLVELQQVEFTPFYAVTGGASSPQATTDGLLVSHTRYQGLQGNIRNTTKPVSFDPQALSQLMQLAPVAPWRAAGGLLLSDDLGTPAVKKFYAPQDQPFAARLVARDAFLAGSDMLYMGNIVSSDASSNYDSIIQTLDYFTQKYREDPSFAKRVDESLMRILAKKYQLYPEFNLNSVTPSAIQLPNVGRQEDTTAGAAALAASLVSPSLADLPNVLPAPPNSRDLVVFITDERSGRQCSTCTQETYLAKDALEQAVLQLYGPQGGDLITSARLSSFNFDEMTQSLPGNQGNKDFEEAVRTANWVVILSLDLPTTSPQGAALRRFINERQDLLRNKNLLLFSLSAPYYLDATDLSKFTAFYSLYGKSQPFVDTAARLLFQEISPAGSSPVSVPAVDYDIAEETAPDPNQVIDLFLDLPPAPTPEPGSSPVPTAVPLFTVGNSLSVRTGVIVDPNGHAVPDGTVARFDMRVDGNQTQLVEAPTMGGVAAATFRLEKEGFTEIRVSSAPAKVSVALQLDVTPGQVAAITVVAPTQEVSPQPTLAPTPVPTPIPEQETFVSSQGRLYIAAWTLGMLIVLAAAGLTFLAASRSRSTRWALRWMLCVFLGGLIAYNYAALGLPGSLEWLSNSGFSALIWIILLGVAVGLLAAFIWERRAARR